LHYRFAINIAIVFFGNYNFVGKPTCNFTLYSALGLVTSSSRAKNCY
jgi:hypothetical protein